MKVKVKLNKKVKGFRGSVLVKNEYVADLEPAEIDRLKAKGYEIEVLDDGSKA